MKLLHTADWHLGQTLFGYDRTDEQQRMLQQMVTIAKQEQPDVFLVCGDVYDTPQPSAAVQTMFNRAIAGLHDACPTMTVIVTAGNHDSGTKHEIFRTPWEFLNVHTIGTPDKENLFSHIIPIPQKGFVIALPYMYERPSENGGRQKELFQHLITEAQRRNDNDLPIVLSAHTAIKGTDFRGHDNSTELTIGGIDAMDIREAGEGYDYFALGHIHRQQFVESSCGMVRYAGSPLPVSFDENYEHTVSVVEIDRHNRQPVVRQIPVINPYPLTTLPTTGFATWDKLKEMLSAFPDDLPSYIRLNVEETETLTPDARAEAMRITEGKQCRICLINRQKTQQANRHTEGRLTVQEFRAMKPIEVAEMYARDVNEPFDKELHTMFEEILQTLNREERTI